MKLIHIENKIDPKDVAEVIRGAKLDFAHALKVALKNRNDEFLTRGTLFSIMADLLLTSENAL